MDDQDKTQVGPAPSKKDSQGRLGTVLAGRYRIVDILGEGAQGAVYVGEHLKIGRRDAIKVLLPDLMEDADAVARFTRGASKASHINHPNVCTVYDFGETEDGLPFMASELVHGQELHDILQAEAPFVLERAVDILEQAAAGLHAAHELNVVHRDLKPANIMITEGRDGREVVKVVDFDIAKGVGESDLGDDGLTKAGWIVGTPQYMSPEQITASDVDARSDIYSLALIFFEMITGKLPNDTGSTQKLMWQRVSGELRGLSEVLPDGFFPPGLQEALDRALANEREDRPATALEFAREVRTAAEAAPEEQFAATVQMEAMEKPSTPETLVGPAAGGGVPATLAAGPDEPAPDDVRAEIEEELPPGRPAPAAERPAWSRPPVLVGGGVGVLVLAGAVAWGTGLVGGGAELPVDLPATMELVENETRAVDAPPGTLPLSRASLAFSENPAVARLSGDSVVAVAVGTTKIVASDGESTDTMVVTVRPDETRLAGGEEGTTSGDAGGTGEPAPRRTTPPTGAAAEEATTRTDPAEVEQRGEGDTEMAREVTTWVTGLDAGEVHERVRGMTRTVLVESPSRATLQAMRDSARVVWDATALPDTTRATAAAVYANASDALGDDDAYCTWMRRAGQLDPGSDAYRNAVQGCGG